MLDDKSSRGEPDRSRINIHETYEVDYWSKKFGITRDRLLEAVAAVGPEVEDVKKDLGLR